MFIRTAVLYIYQICSLSDAGLQLSFLDMTMSCVLNTWFSVELMNLRSTISLISTSREKRIARMIMGIMCTFILCLVYI